VQALIFANRGHEAAAVAKRESLRLRAPGHFCACYPRWSLTGSEIGTTTRAGEYGTTVECGKLPSP
jgi:hypothetical protein